MGYIIKKMVQKTIIEGIKWFLIFVGIAVGSWLPKRKMYLVSVRGLMTWQTTVTYDVNSKVISYHHKLIGAKDNALN